MPIKETYYAVRASAALLRDNNAGDERDVAIYKASIGVAAHRNAAAAGVCVFATRECVMRVPHCLQAANSIALDYADAEEV